jgi:predicted phosphoribosyltransferase
MKRSPYRDRADAGRAVLAGLQAYRATPGLLVLGLARGGLPVAAEVAAGLDAELDVMVVRKLGTPGHEELALGAITADRMVLNESLVRSLRVSPEALDAVVADERRELARREAAYRGDRAPADPAGRVVILVDDGVATGATMRAAALDVRAKGATKVVVAVPTAPAEAGEEFADVADEFVCAYTPKFFVAVGMSYANFNQVDDEEVCSLLGTRR